jgi:hypothetical protein
LLAQVILADLRVIHPKADTFIANELHSPNCVVNGGELGTFSVGFELKN